MNNEWKPTTELPKDGDFILVHKWCDVFAGWFCDDAGGWDYDEYVASCDEDEEIQSREQYEDRRYKVNGRYYPYTRVDWSEVIEWMPLPEVKK